MNPCTSQQCYELLKDHQRQYEKYTQDYTAYKQALQQFEQKQQTLSQEWNPQQIALENFGRSQFVEYQGLPYDCSKNQAGLSCVSASSLQHQKCKCQQLFGNRAHINAPCNAQGNSFSPSLSKEYCSSMGFLDNNGLEYQLFLNQSNINQNSSNQNSRRQQTQQTSNKVSNKVSRMKPSTFQFDTNSQTTLPVEYAMYRPQKPVLIYPSITCGRCVKEFQQLQGEFSLQNIINVQKCIKNIEKQENGLQTELSTQNGLQNALPVKNVTDIKLPIQQQSTNSFVYILVIVLLLSLVGMGGKLYLDYCACCEYDKHMQHHHTATPPMTQPTITTQTTKSHVQHNRYPNINKIIS